MSTSLPGLLSWITATIEQQRGLFSSMLDIASKLESQLDILDPPGADQDPAHSAGHEVLNILALEKEAKAYNACVAEIRKALNFIATISQSQNPTEVDQSNLGQNIAAMLKGRKFIHETFADCSTELLGEIQQGIDQSLFAIKRLIATKTHRFYIQRRDILVFVEGSASGVLLSNSGLSRTTSLVTQGAGKVALELHSLLRFHVQMFADFVERLLPNTPLYYLLKHITLAASLDASPSAQVANTIYDNGRPLALNSSFLALFDALIASPASPGTFKDAFLEFMNQRIDFLLRVCSSIVSSYGVLKSRAYSKLKGVPAMDTSKLRTETLLIAILDFLKKLPDTLKIKNSRDLKDYLLFNDTQPIPPIHDSPIRGDTQLSVPLRLLAHLHRAKLKEGVASFNRSDYIKAIEDGLASSPPPALYKQESHPFYYYFVYVLSMLLDEREQLVMFVNLMLSHYCGDATPFSSGLIADSKPLVESACRLMDVCYSYIATPVLQYVCQVCLGLISNIDTKRLTFETLDMLQVLHAMIPIVFLTNYTEILSFSLGGLSMTDAPSKLVAQAIGKETTVYDSESSFINGMGMNDTLLMTSQGTVDTDSSTTSKFTWNIPFDSINNIVHGDLFTSLPKLYTAIIDMLCPLSSSVVSCSLNQRNFLDQLLYYQYTKSDLNLSTFDSLRHDFLLLVICVALKSKEVLTAFEETLFVIPTRTDSINIISELPNIILRLNQQGLYSKSISLCSDIVKVAQALSPALLANASIEDTAPHNGNVNQVCTSTGFSATTFVDSGAEFVLQDYLFPSGSESLKTVVLEQKLYYLSCILLYRTQPPKGLVNSYLFKLNNLNYLSEAVSSDNGPLRSLVSHEYSRFIRKQVDNLVAKYYEIIWKPALVALDLRRLISDLQHVYDKWHERNSHVITKVVMSELSVVLDQAREVSARIEGTECVPESWTASEVQDDTETLGGTQRPASHASIKSRRITATLTSCLPKFEGLILPLLDAHVTATVPSASLQRKIQDYVLNNVLVVVQQYYNVCQFSPITASAFKTHNRISPQSIQKHIERFFCGTPGSALPYTTPK